MGRHPAQLWLLAALAAACAAGCQDTAPQTYPADPLFSGKRPIEAKAQSAPPTPLAYYEPAAPPVPAVVLAVARPRGPARGGEPATHTTSLPPAPGGP